MAKLQLLRPVYVIVLQCAHSIVYCIADNFPGSEPNRLRLASYYVLQNRPEIDRMHTIRGDVASRKQSVRD